MNSGFQFFLDGVEIFIGRPSPNLQTLNFILCFLHLNFQNYPLLIPVQRGAPPLSSNSPLKKP